MSLYIIALLALLLLLAMVLAIMARDTIERPLTATHDTIVALCELETAHRLHTACTDIGRRSDPIPTFVTVSNYILAALFGCIDSVWAVESTTARNIP